MRPWAIVSSAVLMKQSYVLGKSFCLSKLWFFSVLTCLPCFAFIALL